MATVGPSTKGRAAWRWKDSFSQGLLSEPDKRRLDQTRPGELKTPDEYQRRLDQSRPGELKTPDEYQTSNQAAEEGSSNPVVDLKTNSEDSCLNLTTLYCTTPGDLETQEKYQVALIDAVVGLLSEPDKRRLDKSRHGELKTPDEYLSRWKDQSKRHVLRVSCPDWEKPVMTGDSSPNQTRA
ncbi:hypothetical protein Bbelb_351850 [Branchiostoma belcheri]|nr:hypothetical protein Bbelb_351850 [Branchiostoma belcheri]